MDAELAVDARQVRLDGLGAHERLRRDLLVRQAGGGELRDAQLRARQLLRGAAQPDALELGTRLLGPGRRPEPLEDLERLLEVVGRGATLPRPAVQAPPREQRQAEIEGELRGLGLVELVERGQRARDVAVGGQHERTRARQRDVDPQAREAAPALLQTLEHAPRAVEVAERDERLDAERLAPVGEALARRRSRQCARPCGRAHSRPPGTGRPRTRRTRGWTAAAPPTSGRRPHVLRPLCRGSSVSRARSIRPRPASTIDRKRKTIAHGPGRSTCAIAALLSSSSASASSHSPARNSA